MRRLLALTLITLTACAADPDPNQPAPTADSVPVATECDDVSAPLEQRAHGALSVTPAEPRGPFCYAIASDTPVTLTWSGAPAEYDYVDFMAYTDGAPEFVVIGRDDDPSGGFSITLKFNADTPPTFLFGAGQDLTEGTTLLPAFSDPIVIFIED